MILNRQLDREAPEGENGITVHIRCVKLINNGDSNNQQAIYIPVRIVITGMWFIFKFNFSNLIF